MSFIFYILFFYITLSIAGLPVLFNFYREREYFREYFVELSKHFDNRKYHAVMVLFTKIISFETLNDTIKYQRLKNWTLNDNQHIKFWMMKKIVFKKAGRDMITRYDTMIFSINICLLYCTWIIILFL